MTGEFLNMDTAFFENHPDRFTYIRRMIPGEFSKSILPSQHEHHCTLVFQVGDGDDRVRLPVLFKPDDGPAIPLPYEPHEINNEAVALHGLSNLIDEAGCLEDLIAGWPVDDAQPNNEVQNV